MMRMILNFITQLGTVRVLAIATSLALTATACGGDAASSDRLEIVATTSILGDIVSQVVGEDADVDVIIGPGIDPHDFQASARQVERIGEADLVIAVGLGLEESLIDVIETQAAEALFLGPEIDPIEFVGPDPHSEDDEGEEDHASEGHSDGLDPHVWQDPVRMADAVGLIVERLNALDPSIDWAAKAAPYVDQLGALDEEISQTLSVIPPERRKLVTSHEALGYLADRYDFEIVGVIIAGGSTLSEPSAADLAALAEAIRLADVPAIFTDAYNPTSLASAVASEVDGEVAVVPLITDSLTEDATTYVEMMRENASRIAEALRGAG